MELQHYLDSIRQRWRSGTLVAALIMIVIIVATMLQTPRFVATNQIFVQAQSVDSNGDPTSGVSYVRQQIQSFAELATTPYVLDEVIDELGLSVTSTELGEQISVEVPDETLILEITATSEDPAEAAAIANETARSLTESVTKLAPDAGSAGVVLQVVSPAVAPASPSSPSLVRNGVIGAVVALLAGLATCFVRTLLDTRVRRVSDVRDGIGCSVIATIPEVRVSDNPSMMVAEQPSGRVAEAFREFRTNLRFLGLSDDRRSVVLTSSLPKEGKSSTAVNLAYILMQSGSRVLLVDADLRRPSLHSYLGLEGGAGLTTVLIGDVDLRDVTQPVGDGGLEVLTSGPIPPNPSELLGSPAMEVLLREASESYDVVLIDTAPILAVTDAAVLAQLAGGVVLVAQSDRVRSHELERSIARLDAVDANILGIAMNRVLARTGEDYTTVYAAS